ncbi:MAG: hypothetical protein O3A51_04075, partial [Verrucomicrobia bacterium]|nr:hypothetical protein [Verrucomicrobiota bacterium]
MGASRAAEPTAWVAVRDGKLRGIGGMVTLAVPPGQPTAYVIVHDNKKDGQERVAIITPSGPEVGYQPMAWPTDVELPADIEALDAVTVGKHVTYWAMTSGGRVTQFQLDPAQQRVIVKRQFNLPGVLAGDNYEGLLVRQLGSATIVAWSHRGKSGSPGVLYWGQLVGETIRQNGWAGITVPWPTGASVRHISDLEMDAAGNVYISAASDPGDDGPFFSAIYRAGRFALDDGFFRFTPDLSEIWRCDEHKVEGLTLLRENPPKF